MLHLDEKEVICPYCGETIIVLIEPLAADPMYLDEDNFTVDNQEYIEDCQVCCRPITLRVSTQGNGQTQVLAQHENE